MRARGARTRTIAQIGRAQIGKSSVILSKYPIGNNCARCPPIEAKSSRAGTFSYNFDLSDQRISDITSTGSRVDAFDDSSVEQRALATASAFGSLIRGRRKELKIRQAQLALATGVGRRFLIELEAGKPSCQLGRSLLVAEALGLKPADILGTQMLADHAGPELPDLTEEAQELDGQSPRLL